MKIRTLLIVVIQFMILATSYAQTTTHFGDGSGSGGTDNTNFGYVAGQSSTGSYNINVGSVTGAGLTTGNHNTFIGYASGRFTTTSHYNTFVGSVSGYSNITGTYNVFLGRSAGYSNTTGESNVYVGANSGVTGTTGARNSFVGESAGYYATASDNTLFGYFSGNKISTGARNTFAGGGSGMNTTTGSSNTVSGYRALYLNTTASYNTAVGQEALYNNTIGYMNTGVGFRALYGNTTGFWNTALGYQANVSNGGLSNATAIGYRAIATASHAIQLGNDSVTQVFAGVGTKATLVTGGLKVTGGIPAVGKVLTSDASGVATWQTPSISGSWSLTGNAGTIDGTHFIGTTDNVPFTIRVNNLISGRVEVESGNTAYGYRAGNVGVSVGQYNTANGSGALRLNTAGTRNTALGYQTLYDNTTADGNTAVGFQTLAHTLTAYNTAVGAYTLSMNTTGAENTAQGFSAMLNNTSGSYNNALGARALHANTTGVYNAAFGHQALLVNATGGNNSAFGAQAGPNATNLDNTTALGSGATTTASNQVRIGNASVTSIGGQVSWSTLSDGRFKKEIREDVSGLDFINQLRPVSYTIDQGAFNAFVGAPDNGQRVRAAVREDGFVAQEVEALVKKNGYVFHGVEAPKNDKDHYSIRYAEFVVPLVKAVQELSTRVEAQQLLIESLLSERSEKHATTVLRGEEQAILLYQNVPNPFSADTEIKLALPETARQVSLVIYNLEGTQLKALTIQDRGTVSAKISANTLQAGMYLYALIVDGKVIDTKRMILTK